MNPRIALAALAAVLLMLGGCGQPADERPATTPEPDHEMATTPETTPDTLIDRERLFGNPERAQGRLSPDGSTVSFLAPLDGVLNVWVAPADNIADATAITRDTGRGIRNHFWSPDGEWILYLQDTDGDENFLLYAVSPDGEGDPRNLTPFDDTTAQVVRMSRDHPDTILVGLNNRDARWHDVHRLTLSTGELELVTEGDGFLGFLADHDLNVRLAMRPRQGGGMDLLRRDGEAWETLLTVEQEDDLSTQPFDFTSDNSRIYMVDSRDRDTAALVTIDVDSGEREVLGESDRADVSNVVIDRVSRDVVAYAVNHKQVEWHPLDEGFARDFEFLGERIDGELSVASQSADGSRWLVVASDATVPGRYYLYEREAREVRPLFDTRPQLADEPLTPMHPLVIRSRDGLDLVSYLSLPRWTDPDGDGRPSEPQPLVLLVHGGPWARDSFGYQPEHQWLANRGYAVLSVNFRGSTGFGKSFINAADGEWAGKMHDDLIDAVEWAIDAGITTSEQVAIMGGSYGGYATLVGLTFTPETFACGVDIVGPSNLETLLESIPPYWEAFFENLARRVGDPRTDEGRELLRERSPLHFADRIERPLLIAQGANDPRVKQAESDQIVEAMQANELPVTYVLYPDEGHGFARPENRLAFYGITEVFLYECLGGQAQPIDGALEGSTTEVPVGADFVTGLAEELARWQAAD